MANTDSGTDAAKSATAGAPNTTDHISPEDWADEQAGEIVVSTSTMAGFHNRLAAKARIASALRVARERALEEAKGEGK